MNLSDYLIDQKDLDWATILREWYWLLPSNLTAWMVNRFGDVIFVLADDTVHLLDVGAGSTKQLAGSREDFFTKVDLGGNADNWLLITLTDACVAAGLTLGPKQCYGFKVTPIFDGKYTIENIEVIDIETNYSLSAQIHSQIKDLPDGSHVELVVGT